MAKTPAEFARSMRNLEHHIEGANREAVFKSALHVKDHVSAQLAAAGVRGRLSGVGKRGARISVGFDIKGSTNPTAAVRMRGPAQLIERDTKPHTIKPKRKTKALKTPYGPRASVKHPGTKGKRPWEKGVRAAQPGLPRIVERTTREAMHKALR